MADRFGDLDWRDRPAASPGCGSIVQSRRGKNGDFHVVLPGPAGEGLAHWRRDNFRPELPWSNGTLFGDARYVGAAVAETDYTSHPPTNVKNLDAVAVTQAGRVELWMRECGGDYRWSLLTVFAEEDGAGAPSLFYTGACLKTGILDFEVASHGIGCVFVAYPSKKRGVAFWWCRTAHKGRQWKRIAAYFQQGSPDETFFTRIDPRPVIGVSAAPFIDRENAITAASWKAAWQGHEFVGWDDVAVVTTFEDGGATVFFTSIGGVSSPVIDTDAEHHLTFYVSVPLTRPLAGGGTDATPARGRPCVFQSEYLLVERAHFGPIFQKSPQVGDLVVMAPARDGGILFWLKNFGDYNDPVSFDEGWNFQYVIGTELYDEVSCIQGNFLNKDSSDHNIEITARRHDMPGFHQYWCDFHGHWGGPLHVLGEITGSVRQELELPSAPVSLDRPVAPPPPPAPIDPIAALADVGIDYSVAETDLRDWLANPEHTPYPALAAALLATVRPFRLKRPVQIDVVRGFYEDSIGIASPRKQQDVDIARLRAAILLAFNERYGETQTQFEALLGSA